MLFLIGDFSADEVRGESCAKCIPVLFTTLSRNINTAFVSISNKNGFLVSRESGTYQNSFQNGCPLCFGSFLAHIYAVTEVDL